jgi:phosphatidylserine/phosphatidylglycerophosphate/cardiolipin synthase-like enzyme
MSKIEFITDRRIYEQVILGAVPSAREFLWLATSDLKDLYVHRGKQMVPFLELLSGLIANGVATRLLHAKEPGPAFRKDFDRYPNLLTGLERILCPRVHFKSVIVDGRFAYSGSANLTGAGMGAKGEHRRNFEGGFVTQDPDVVQSIMDQFDRVWMGAACDRCQRKSYCADYPELLERAASTTKAGPSSPPLQSRGRARRRR